MTKKYIPAIFQPTVRPSWVGILSYLSEKEKSDILEAIIKYPSETEISSMFWRDTIKPDLDEQYSKFLNICNIRGLSAKTYWGELKLSSSYTKDNHKDNLFKDKDKDKDKVKEKDKNNNRYGELKNVLLTDEQYLSLKEKHSNIDEAIEVVDTWLGTSGSKYKNKNHYAYFKSNSWVWDRVKPKDDDKYDRSWLDKYEITNEVV